MGKATLNIPYVTWRNGRPRFIPGPEMRKRGHAGADLRHPDGRWFTYEEASAWSAAFADRLKAEPAPDRPARRSGKWTIGHLLEHWFKDPRMNGQALVEGRKMRPPLAPKTVESYRRSANIVRDFDNGFVWSQTASAVTGPGMAAAIDNIEKKHGLAQARAIRACLSAAYSWAVKGRGRGGITHNPVLGNVDLPGLPPRVRFGEVAEMKALIAAADAIGLPEIGDAIVLGLWSGQRQITANGIGFRQHKKHGQPLLIPRAPEFEARMKAARARRAGWRINYPHVILDEQRRRPFTDASRYRKLFVKARAAAVAGIEGPDGEWIVGPCPSLADFRDQDLRDTAVTWLALSGSDILRISAVTGHAPKSAATILQHYLGMHPELARTAIAAMVEWYATQTEGETNG